MQDYRLYFLERGHIVRAAEMDCADDATAIALANQRRQRQAAELWQRDRLVRSFAPASPTHH